MEEKMRIGREYFERQLNFEQDKLDSIKKDIQTALKNESFANLCRLSAEALESKSKIEKLYETIDVFNQLGNM